MLFFTLKVLNFLNHEMEMQQNKTILFIHNKIILFSETLKFFRRLCLK